MQLDKPYDQHSKIVLVSQSVHHHISVSTLHTRFSDEKLEAEDL